MLFKCCWKSAMRKWERVTFRSCHLRLARWSARFPESEWVKGNSWSFLSIPYSRGHDQSMYETRSSWLNCGLRGDEAVYWVSIGQHGWYLAVPRQYETVIDVVGSVEGTDAFIYWKIGDLVRCYRCPNRLTDSQLLVNIFSSVRSSNSHPDLLLIQHHVHHPIFSDLACLPLYNIRLSLSEPL